MKNDRDIAIECLRQIHPANLEYDEWLAVGAALKHAGCSVDDWDNWSKQDPRYKTKDCFNRWEGLGKGNREITVATLIKLCRENGGNIKSEFWDEPDQEISFDQIIGGNTKEKYKVVQQDWLEGKDLPPIPENYNGAEDLKKYLQMLFNAEDYVGVVVESYKSEPDANGNTKWLPKKGTFTRNAGDIIDELERCKGDLGRVIGDWNNECGAWIRFNPLDGKGVADSNVTAYRHALVESDEISVEKQFEIYHSLELPIAALVESGGKSLHAIVKIDASDFKEYQQRVDFLYNICKKNGLVIDRKNRNPSRLSRLPGVNRGNKIQRLIEVNTGKASWAEWREWIEATNDELPDFESLQSVWDNLPPLADELITGILRKGHKMLVSGPSKAGKSYLLLELAASIASGQNWLKWKCEKGRVAYINLELDKASCWHRLRDICNQQNLRAEDRERIEVWNLRGLALPMNKLAPMLIRRALKKNYAAIILDPIYKVITGDENSADQMAAFCNAFDKVCTQVKCAMIYCHHHSKGDQGQKRAQDRASGSGVFARDPDALLDMIELDITKQRPAIEDQKVVEAIKTKLDTVNPNWNDDISYDDALIRERLTEYARKYIDENILNDISAQAIENANSLSAWQIGGILREFKAFKPLNIFFQYPRHITDTDGILDDCAPVGELQFNKKGKSTNSDKKKNQTNIETKKAIDILKQGNRPVKVKEVMEYFGISDPNTRIRIKNAGYKIEKGFIFEDFIS